MKGICIVVVVVFPKGKNNTTIEIDHAEAIVETTKNNPQQYSNTSEKWVNGEKRKMEGRFQPRARRLGTPPVFFRELNDELALSSTARRVLRTRCASRYLTAEDDALTQPWAEFARVCWLNPPYSQAAKFIEKDRTGAYRYALVSRSPSSSKCETTVRLPSRDARPGPGRA